MWTQEEISKRIRDQLYLLDPEISAEVGTPERKIIDVVAQSLADIQFENFIQNYQFDIDTKFGQDLDDFVQLFGFARQTAKRAVGFVTFSRNQGATAETLIPAGTIISTVSNAISNSVDFVTVSDGLLTQNQNFVKVPIECVIPGTSGNVSANSIILSTSGISNVSSITNDLPTSGGTDGETDDELRLRFKNNIFRNIAGLEDQFLALSIANEYTNRATILKAANKFSEYIEFGTTGAGTATSQNRNAKYIYDFNYYVTSQGNEISEFYSPDVHYDFNVVSDGDLKYPQLVISGTALTKPGTAPSVQTFDDVTDGLLTSEYQYGYTYHYATGGESGLSPASGTVTISNGSALVSNLINSVGTAVDYMMIYRKDLLYDNTWAQIGSVAGTVTTFGDNEFVGSLIEPPAAGLEPQTIVFLEHEYISQWSRNIIDDANSYSNLNKIDIYISGQQLQDATDIVYGSGNLLNNTYGNKYYYKNYIRDYTGDNCAQNNYLINLIWNPVRSLPSQITINGQSYELNSDYWLAKDITNLRDSQRSRDGLEITAAMASAIAYSSYSVDYSFDKLPLLTNQVIDAHKQIGQDVLVHTANFREFLINLQVIYSNGFVVDTVNNQLSTNLTEYFTRQRFGSVIQFNDILNIAYQTSGVDNVRFVTSADVAGTGYSSYYGVQEINPNGSVKQTYTNDFTLNEIDLPLFYGLGPVDKKKPLQKTQSTWIA